LRIESGVENGLTNDAMNAFCGSLAPTHMKGPGMPGRALQMGAGRGYVRFTNLAVHA
jgi:hypothetical protein